jgi:hypothetical protein
VLMTNMPSWYGSALTDAHTAARGSDRRSARCAACVRRGGTATRTGVTSRHVGARVPRDAAASTAVVSGSAWRGRGVAARRCGARLGRPGFILLGPTLDNNYSKNLNRS